MPSFIEKLLKNFFPEMVSYLPLIPYLNTIVSAESAVERTNGVLELARFGANLTHMELDNQFLNKLGPMLKTKEGQEFVTWAAEMATAGIYAMEPIAAAEAACEVDPEDEEFE